jgi:hypothetical protein
VLNTAGTPSTERTLTSSKPRLPVATSRLLAAWAGRSIVPCRSTLVLTERFWWVSAFSRKPSGPWIIHPVSDGGSLAKTPRLAMRCTSPRDSNDCSA